MQRLIVILFLLITSCNSDEVYEVNGGLLTPNPTESLSKNCGMEDGDIYKLNEIFFDKNEVLTLRLKVVYFTNDYKNLLTEKYFENRIKLSNYFFKSANIKFEFNGLEYVYGRPNSDLNNLKHIESFEKLNGGKVRKDIRSRYYIDHFHFWNSVYSEEGTLTAYVYNNGDDRYWAGIAGGIGSTYFAIDQHYLNPKYHTWEHELGHDLGLFHTHQYDHTDGLNNLTGDLVCDTYTSSDTLINTINHLCEYDGSLDIPDEHIETLVKNLMSYTQYQCRSEFTPFQNMRKRKIIETNSDLRKCIVGYQGLNMELWKNLREIP